MATTSSVVSGSTKGPKFAVYMVPNTMDSFIKTLDESKVVILGAAHAEAAEAVKKSLTWGFDRATKRVKKNTEATIKWKIFQGLGSASPLIMTGALRDSMKNADASVTYSTNRVVGMVEIGLPVAGSNGVAGAGRKNKNFPYPLAHLFGAGGGMRKFSNGPAFTLPKRDFLSEGIKQGGQKAATILGAAYKKYYEAFIAPEYFNQRFVPFAWEKQVSFGVRDILALAMPPTATYAIFGAGLDFTNAFMLTFNAFTINSWFGSLAAGHAGLTKRTYLRRGRKTLYRGI